MVYKSLLKAAKGDVVRPTPIWFMRQAGRYLPEYRALREKYSFLEVCQTPELAAEISLQPWRRFGVDGVILFSDITVPAHALGMNLSFEPGPCFESPIRILKDVETLRRADPKELCPSVCQALRLIREEVGSSATVIGFCGAPWTTACYMVEGTHRPGFPTVMAMVQQNPEVLEALLEKVTSFLILYLKRQIEAGAEVIQIFDTWAEVLSEKRYREIAFSHLQKLLDAISDEVPVILFMKNTQAFFPLLQHCHAGVISVDSKTSLIQARNTLGRVLQGNLDPERLRQGSLSEIEKTTREILQEMSGAAHIFNLGHGILPETPLAHVHRVIEVVR
ncbi:MAG: uroporphyrinogen decarboxylase [Deltaproteobacteria bacterium]|nr:uroporphyrinogen decarboxylase [Deltaproteobacteria bacterium]